jgi:hypothetical protein
MKFRTRRSIRKTSGLWGEGESAGQRVMLLLWGRLIRILAFVNYCRVTTG